jgi:hypothetical protein
MRQLRESFERTRILIDLIRGRELKKKKHLKAVRDAFVITVRGSRLVKDQLVDEDSQMSNHHESIPQEDFADPEIRLPEMRLPLIETEAIDRGRKRRRESAVETPIKSPPVKLKNDFATSTHTPSKLAQTISVGTSPLLLPPSAKSSLLPSATKKYTKSPKKPSTPNPKTPTRKDIQGPRVPSPSPVTKPFSPAHKNGNRLPDADPFVESAPRIELKRDDDEDDEVDIDGDDRRVNRSRGEAPPPGHYADDMDVDGREEEDDGEFPGATGLNDDNSLDEVVLLDASPHSGRKRRKLDEGSFVESSASPKPHLKSPTTKTQDTVSAQPSIMSFFQKVVSKFKS